ncbi:MAG: 3-hydroxy-5-phosphonooxypentane-2,4-dione thiolase [Spirochaetales bacterium]|nr:3-hydroxy-5-phosphonooxypentane-2,4-dione thiolase [Spirochaetales bacterium]
MADLDDIRDGNNFGVGIPVEGQSFYIKGHDHAGWGLKNRLANMFNKKSGNSVMLAFDHGFLMGPTSGLERVDLNILPLAPYVDVMMGCKGMIRSTVPADCETPIALRADAGTTILTTMNDNVVMDINEALAMNAQCMAVMLSVGCKDTEATTVKNLFTLADKANPLGMPVMGITAVGKDMVRDARYFGLASRVCAENGANIVKTYYTEGFEKVVAGCPVPVVIAGGKKLPELEALELSYKAISCGAVGVDMGRNIFQSEDPAAMAQAVAGVVHDGLTPEQGLEKFNDLKG